MQDSRGTQARKQGKQDGEPRPVVPAQHPGKAGRESRVRPRAQAPGPRAAGKLAGRTALVTGGDSGIGRAVAVLYAREGADVAITCLAQEHDDAMETCRSVEKEGRRCLVIEGDLATVEFCRACVERTVHELGKLDLLVSNAVFQNRRENPEDVSDEQWERAFRVNVDAYFYLVKAALPHLQPGAAIIATSSIDGIEGNGSQIDSAATQGAINALTKSLAESLVSRGIRVNAVAPGPAWTPLRPSSSGTPAELDRNTAAGRDAQPEEIAPAYVFFASAADCGDVTGEVLSEPGGTRAAAD